MRLKIIKLVIASFFLVLIVGLFHLQIIKGKEYYELSRYNCIRIVPIEGNRGRILDRNGIVLADTRVSFDAVIISQEIKNKKELFSFLSKTLEIDRDVLLRIFKEKSAAPFVPVVIQEDIDQKKAVILEENKFRFPGLFVNVGAKREYPFGEIGSHVLGYVSRINQDKVKKFKDYGFTIQDVTGYSGVEEYYDNFLRGQDGGFQVEVNNRGEQVRLLGMREPVKGQDIVLGIDARIQKIAGNLLSDKKGAIVVLDLDTGEVIGMVSAPSFDPSIFTDISKSRKKARLFLNSSAPMMNRAISGQYPPGSAFKIPMAIAALDQKKISTDKTFLCNGSYLLGRRSFNCSHSHGIQNFTEAVAHSCNVYFYNVGLLLGPKAMEEYAYLFGFGIPTNIDLPYEKSGLIPDSKKTFKRSGRSWSKGDTLNFSIGQGDVLTTPIQLVNMIATVARDGKEITPHVMVSTGDVDNKKLILSRDIDIPKEYFEDVKVGMKAAVGDYTGTAHLLAMSNILVLGKTGTAQTSQGKRHHSWFVGFCPETNQKIAFCVLLEHGGSSYYACRVAKKLLTRMRKEKII